MWLDAAVPPTSMPPAHAPLTLRVNVARWNVQLTLEPSGPTQRFPSANSVLPELAPPSQHRPAPRFACAPGAWSVLFPAVAGETPLPRSTVPAKTC